MYTRKGYESVSFSLLVIQRSKTHGRGRGCFFCVGNGFVTTYILKGILLLVLHGQQQSLGHAVTAAVDANKTQPERVRVHTAVVRVVCQLLDTRCEYVKYNTPPWTYFRAEFLDNGEKVQTLSNASVEKASTRYFQEPPGLR